MGRRGWRSGVGAGAGAVTLASAAALGAQAPDLAAQRQRLATAKAQAAAAAERSRLLDQAAAGERDAAAKARAQEAAVQAKVTRAEAQIVAAQARVAIVDRLLDDQRARLAAGEAPVARLLAALQSMARRPALAAVAQPGSVDDLVHVRAVLGSTLPTVRARTLGIRTELARTRQLQADARLAAAALRDGRVELGRQRAALAALEARHSERSVALARSALTESDRAIAMGERARDIVDRMEEAGDLRATGAELAALPGPPAPAVAGAGPLPPAYRLPVTGRVVTGLGEVSDAGVRARGLTLAVAPGASVVAPSGGRVVFARPFRAYGTIVILDHGAGWTTLVTGLSAAAVHRGQGVRSGTPLGRAGTGEDPQVTVELRRRGRPVDITALL